MSESRLVIDNQEYQTYLSELGKGLGLVSSRVPGLGLVSSRCPGSWVGYLQYNLQYLPGPKRWELRYSKHQGGTVTKHKQNILIFVSSSCSYFSLSRSISSFSLDSSSISSYPAFSYFCSRFPSWLSAVPFMHTQKHCKTNSYVRNGTKIFLLKGEKVQCWDWDFVHADPDLEIQFLYVFAL